MREAKLCIPVSPGDKLFAVIGDKVRECTIDVIHVHLHPDFFTHVLDVSFSAPDPYMDGKERIYRELVKLGEREVGYYAAYTTAEAAEKALSCFGPDDHSNKK